MLKLTPTFLMSLYLMVSIGINGASHFCGEDLVSFSFFGITEEADCGEDSCCEFPEDDSDCCTSEKFTLLFEAERTFIGAQKRTIEKLFKTAQFILFTQDALEDERGVAHNLISLNNKSPGSVPFYLLHQSLIFYG